MSTAVSFFDHHVSLEVAMAAFTPEMRGPQTVALSTQETTSMTALLPDFEQLCRKEKRKILKKLRRKLLRRQAAEEETLEQHGNADDTGQSNEELEAGYSAEEKVERDEQERLWIEREKKAMEDFQRQQEERRKMEENMKPEDKDEDWRYVESDGQAEIIWKGNEIIVRKRRVKVIADPPASQDVKVSALDEKQPTSNPLPPQSAAFAAHKYSRATDTNEQAPMFGTEQDKTHCPFHIKTGVCRFGVRCSRVHVYPDQSFTLLIRNMYTGPGLICENDEGLEYSDEEVAQHYEEFYEDVHSEFLQFGELVNFKVAKNGSSHLRGNVYVHYKTEACAQAAYSALNGRFYAGKQITCEFVGVTRWRVALCGEYMKGHHRSCSHGTACNFLHCFQNPGGDYDWADWDRAPPRYWVVKMAKLFGYEKDLEHDENDNNEDIRRHYRGVDSPRRRESRDRRHRSRDTHYHETSVDEIEHTSGHRRVRSRGGHYHSDSDEGESPLNHGRHSRRDRRHYSASKEVNSLGRAGEKAPVCHSSDDDNSVSRDNLRLEGRGRKRGSYTLDSHDLSEECVQGTHGSRRVKTHDRSYSRDHSSRCFEQDDRYGHVNRCSLPRDNKDYDYQQSSYVSSREGRQRSPSSELDCSDQCGSVVEGGTPKKRSHRKDSASASKVAQKSRNRRTETCPSIHRTDESHERYRYHGQKSYGGHHHSKRKVESLENVTNSTESKTFDEDDRWTGSLDS